ncbi:RNA ligase [Thermovibrio guaymasensis]|uniref:RNA ligase n=1 Tax=Thermovibrio guaymasensis TaxID=240167 RepID=A0A420W5X4_9BACT|nr:RNA ligase [Thermovibrio guaymasensis]RKQ60565.1 RNA ligase [Thermovibrio guaymasensis]
MKIKLPEVLKEVEGNKFFKVIEKDGLIKVSYRFNSPKVFDSPIKRELRGITFSKGTGEVVSRPFHKFFNLDESEESRRENLEGKEFIFREKLDGTMLHPVILNGELKLLTQKDFENPQTKKGEELLKKKTNLYEFTKRMVEKGFTPIFELVSPEFQLVIPYDREELFLTEVRNNRTGEYLLERTEEELKEAGFELPEKITGKFEDVEKELKNREMVEGFVLKDFSAKEPFPLFVKLKSPWYYDRHYAFTYLHNIPPHKLFNLYLMGKHDDVFSKVLNRKLRERREEELRKMVELLLNLSDLVSKYRELPTGKAVKKIISQVKKQFSDKFKKLELEENYISEALRIAKKRGKFENFLGNKLYILLKEGKIILR